MNYELLHKINSLKYANFQIFNTHANFFLIIQNL